MSALRRDLAGPPSARTVVILQVLKLYLPVDEWLDLLLPELLADPTSSDLAALLLQALDGCRESEYPSAVRAAADVRGVVAAMAGGPRKPARDAARGTTSDLSWHD